METYETVSVHQYLYEADNGDIVDCEVFCSNECHREWCADNGKEFQGWNGCNEVDAPQWCANCREKV